MGEEMTEELLASVDRRTERIEVKLDTALIRLDDHEKRIRSGERNQWFFSGVAAIIGAMFGGKLPWHL